MHAATPSSSNARRSRTTPSLTPIRCSPLAVPLVCPRCRTPLDASESSLACPGCRATYPIVGDVPVLLDAPSEQQVGQREYFDAEFAGYGTYSLDNWRLSFIERIFGAL